MKYNTFITCSISSGVGTYNINLPFTANYCSIKTQFYYDDGSNGAMVLYLEGYGAFSMITDGYGFPTDITHVMVQPQSGILKFTLRDSSNALVNTSGSLGLALEWSD